MTLTRAEVEAIVDYIYTHVRANPTGRGYKVWQRMIEFLNNGEIDGSESHIQRELFGHDGTDAGWIR